jgi:hypothetical protein
MNRSKLIKWGFKLLCAVGISIILCGNIVNAQGLTDKNFKSKVSKGFVLVKFKADYQMRNLDPELLKGVKGHEGCVIIEVNRDDVKKVVKKLRIRNYPSLALFHNGSKKKVWKADMDGEVDVTNKDIKSEIEDAMAGDVF